MGAVSRCALVTAAQPVRHPSERHETCPNLGNKKAGLSPGLLAHNNKNFKSLVERCLPDHLQLSKAYAFPENRKVTSTGDRRHPALLPAFSPAHSSGVLASFS